MPKYQVTFKGPRFDVTVSGDTPEQLVEDYQNLAEKIEKILGHKLHYRAKGSRPSGDLAGVSLSGEVSLANLSIPEPLTRAFVETRDRLTNWDTLFLLLHHAPDGLTNKQIRSLSEELGKPIRYSWFDGEFHRRDNEGLVVSKRVPGQREKLYFLAELGKRQAAMRVRELGEINAKSAIPE